MRTRSIATLIAVIPLLTQLGLAQEIPAPAASTPAAAAAPSQPAAAAAPSQPAAAAAPSQPAATTPAMPQIQKGQMEVPGQPGVLEDKHAFGVLPNYRT